MKKKFRQIVVNGQSYLWQFTPSYRPSDDSANPWQCQDRFTAYLPHMKASPLQISFLTWEDPTVGGPLRTGMPLDLEKMYSRSYRINLHSPKYAAWIIQKALEAGWQPQQGGKPFIIEQGVEWLNYDYKKT